MSRNLLLQESKNRKHCVIQGVHLEGLMGALVGKYEKLEFQGPMSSLEILAPAWGMLATLPWLLTSLEK